MASWDGLDRFVDEVVRVSGSEFTVERVHEIIEAGWTSGMRPVRAVLNHKDLLSENDLRQIILRQQSQVQISDPSKLDYGLAKLLPLEVCKQYSAIIYKKEDETLYVATRPATAQSADAAAHIRQSVPEGWQVEIEYGEQKQIAACIAALQRSLEVGLTSTAEVLTAEDLQAEAEDRWATLTEGGTEAETVVGGLMAEMLLRAVSSDTSDIHISNQDKDDGGQPVVKVRMRRIGTLHDHAEFSPSDGRAIINRFRITGGMSLDETRPDDARYDIEVPGIGRYDLRLSYVPKANGSMFTIRLLPQKRSMVQTLDQIFPNQFTGVTAEIRRALTMKPDSIFLVVGPTGQGKSTTLAAIMHELNRPDVKCVSVEDPVEYRIGGVEQVQVISGRMDFARVLRAFLRSDPDVIMVGEIRDDETATMAVQAAQTGHRVLTTLHVRSAALAPQRLLDLGGGKVTPMALADALCGVLSQRLVRVLCSSCARVSSTGEADLGDGCEVCDDTGWGGQVAVAETLVVNDAVTEGIMAGAPPKELVRLSGSQSYGDHARKLLNAGRTTRAELLRVFGELPEIAEGTDPENNNATQQEERHLSAVENLGATDLAPEVGPLKEPGNTDAEPDEEPDIQMMKVGC